MLMFHIGLAGCMVQEVEESKILNCWEYQAKIKGTATKFVEGAAT